jgi:Domain of unknown function (DUF1905)
VRSMTDGSYSFDAEVWEHIGSSAWFFVSLPEDVTDDIDERFEHLAAGFGSIRVEVTIGASTWKTSLFPDTKRGTFVLPVKKQVRTKEGLVEGSIAQISIQVVQ